MVAGLWSNTAAITSIAFGMGGGGTAPVPDLVPALDLRRAVHAAVALADGLARGPQGRHRPLQVAGHPRLLLDDHLVLRGLVPADVGIDRAQLHHAAVRHRTDGAHLQARRRPAGGADRTETGLSAIKPRPNPPAVLSRSCPAICRCRR